MSSNRKGGSEYFLFKMMSRKSKKLKSAQPKNDNQLLELPSAYVNESNTIMRVVTSDFNRLTVQYNRDASGYADMVNEKIPEMEKGKFLDFISDIDESLTKKEEVVERMQSAKNWLQTEFELLKREHKDHIKKWSALEKTPEFIEHHAKIEQKFSELENAIFNDVGETMLMGLKENIQALETMLDQLKDPHKIYERLVDSMQRNDEKEIKQIIKFVDRTINNADKKELLALAIANKNDDLAILVQPTINSRAKKYYDQKTPVHAQVDNLLERIDHMEQHLDFKVKQIENDNASTLDFIDPILDKAYKEYKKEINLIRKEVTSYYNVTAVKKASDNYIQISRNISQHFDRYAAQENKNLERIKHHR